jgi:hypothetical protein
MKGRTLAASWRERLRHLWRLWRLPHQVEQTNRAVAEASNRLAEVERGLAVNAERLGSLTEAGGDAAVLDTLAARLAMLEQTVLGVQRRRLRERVGAIRIATEHPVATASPDHVKPWGTANDNSRNQRFNARLTALLEGEVSVLDLGCSGGGAVRSFVEQGYLAVGVEAATIRPPGCARSG